jgi:hypothetical protein
LIAGLVVKISCNNRVHSNRKIEVFMKRRDFIKLSGVGAGLALIPVCNLAVADDPARLTAEDPQANALGYVEQSTDANSHCSNCMQAKGELAEEWVGCNIFPGKEVKATGWCKVWSPRA